MNIFITRINGYWEQATVQYAQSMTTEIAHQLGIKEMALYHYLWLDEPESSLNPRLDGIISGIARGDIVFFQFPSWNGLRFDRALINKIHVYGGRVVIFVHDIEAMMMESGTFMLPDTIDILNSGDALILPSRSMRQYLVEQGLHKDKKVLFQQIWDYITVPMSAGKPAFKKEFQFAGSPKQFPIPNQWNYEIPLHLYSDIECSGAQMIREGWLYRPQLLTELSRGGFGLAWYESGLWKEYIKYNCCFKIGTYLAAGIPVVVQRGSSSEELLEKNKLGFAADTLDEAIERIRNMTEQEYEDYIAHVEKFAFLVRNGYFTKKVLIDAIHMLQQEAFELN